MSDLMSIIKKSCQFIQSLLFHHEKSACEALSIAFYSQAQEGANQLQMQNLSKGLGPTLAEEVQPMLNGSAPQKITIGGWEGVFNPGQKKLLMQLGHRC